MIEETRIIRFIELEEEENKTMDLRDTVQTVPKIESIKPKEPLKKGEKADWEIPKRRRLS